MSTTYDAWLTSVDTKAEEYERYWETYYEKADDLLQDGKYNDDFVEFLEGSDWNKRYEDLREEFLTKLAAKLEKAERQNTADILTEMAAIDYFEPLWEQYRD